MANNHSCVMASNTLIDSFADQHRLFFNATCKVEQAQGAKLREIVGANNKTIFGLDHQLDMANHSDVDAYRKSVPIREYNDYLPYIEQIKSGKEYVLTRERVCCFEPTSGSTGYSKLIPYTKSLYQEFQNGIAPWLYDIYKRYDIGAGRFYWSITPMLNCHLAIDSAVPLGIDNDFNYFDGSQQKALLELSVVPLTIKEASCINQFKINTLMHLLLADDLVFVSIWNPDYLRSLFGCLDQHADVVFDSMRDHPKIAHLKKLWERYGNTSEFYSNIWPNLKLISCWVDASATSDAAILKQAFPHAYVQGKGLIATEAFISFPFGHLPGHLLSVCSHFFEFKPLGKFDNTYLAHELDIGERYEVVITTGGGLYRYNTNDIVEIIDYHKQVPLLRFVGRNHVIDQVGEKVNEFQLSSILQQLENSLLTNTQFLLCSPERDINNQLQYTLFVNAESEDSYLHEFARQLEESLMKNYHYEYARKLGQLDKVRIFRLYDGREAKETYLARLVNQGKQLGQIKPAHIDRHLGWSSVFKGEWL